MSAIETSPEIGELAKALPKAQAAIAKITKDTANTHFNSRYASLTEIAEAILPAMNANGFSVIQGVTAAPNAGVQVTTRLLHASAQWMEATHFVPVSRQDAQGVGSALTYARRQALQAFFTVAPAGEDDDGEGSVGRGPGRPPLNPAGPPSAPPKTQRPARVARLEKTLADVKTIADLTRAWDLAKALRAELAAEEPETAKRLDALHKARSDALLGCDLDPQTGEVR
jgi:hypothetical protein